MCRHYRLVKVGNECVPSAPLSLTSFQKTLAQGRQSPHQGSQDTLGTNCCPWLLTLSSACEFCSCSISHLWICCHDLHCPLPRTLLIHVFSSLKFSLRLPQDTRAFSRLFLTTTRQRSFLKYGLR